MNKFLKKKWLAVFIIVLLLILSGFYFLNNSNKNKPPEVPRISSALLQGKISKDGGMLIKSFDKKYDSKKFKGDKVKLKGGSINIGFSEGSKTLFDVVSKVKPLTSDTKTVYMFWNSEEQKWVSTQEKIYNGTRTVKESNLAKEKIIGGGVLMTDSDVDAVDFNTGGYPADKNLDACNDLVIGWQIRVLPSSSYSDSYSKCLHDITAIWEKAPDGSNNFKQVSLNKIDKWKVKNYIHWVLIEDPTIGKVTKDEVERAESAVYELYCDAEKGVYGKEGISDSEIWKLFKGYGFSSQRRAEYALESIDFNYGDLLKKVEKECGGGKSLKNTTTSEITKKVNTALYEYYCSYEKGIKDEIKSGDFEEKIAKKHGYSGVDDFLEDLDSSDYDDDFFTKVEKECGYKDKVPYEVRAIYKLAMYDITCSMNGGKEVGYAGGLAWMVMGAPDGFMKKLEDSVSDRKTKEINNKAKNECVGKVKIIEYTEADYVHATGEAYCAFYKEWNKDVENKKTVMQKFDFKEAYKINGVDLDRVSEFFINSLDDVELEKAKESALYTCTDSVLKEYIKAEVRDVTRTADLLAIQKELTTSSLDGASYPSKNICFIGTALLMNNYYLMEDPDPQNNLNGCVGYYYHSITPKGKHVIMAKVETKDVSNYICSDLIKEKDRIVGTLNEKQDLCFAVFLD